jgi:hypothetical protein
MIRSKKVVIRPTVAGENIFCDYYSICENRYMSRLIMDFIYTQGNKNCNEIFPKLN